MVLFVSDGDERIRDLVWEQMLPQCCVIVKTRAGQARRVKQETPKWERKLSPTLLPTTLHILHVTLVHRLPR
jgi:hypothetical protein